MMVSHHQGEFYFQGTVDTPLPSDGLALQFQGSLGTYPGLLFRAQTGNDASEGPLYFRGRLPFQSFSAQLTYQGQPVPVHLTFAQGGEVGCWLCPFPYQVIPGKGFWVPHETGFNLVTDKVWIWKRRLLHAWHNHQRGALTTLDFNGAWGRDVPPRAETKNRFLLGNEGCPAVPNTVNIDYWVPADDNYNLGDYLALVICEWMLGKRGLALSSPVSQTRFLATVGSILDLGLNDCTVWGAGLLWDLCPSYISPDAKRMDIRAVRGPKTRQLLQQAGYDCPQVYGDPACLMPLIYQPQRPKQRKPYAVVSHMFDRTETDLDIMTKDYQAFVDGLVGAEMVISSSLHGIILAESYGVPAVLLDDFRPDFTLHKYQDWYLSTGRSTFPVATSVEQAKSMEPPPLPALDAMRNQLLETFPYDMWEDC